MYMCMYMYVHMFVYIYVCIASAYVYVYMYVYMYVYVYICNSGAGDQRVRPLGALRGFCLLDDFRWYLLHKSQKNVDLDYLLLLLVIMY